MVPQPPTNRHRPMYVAAVLLVVALLLVLALTAQAVDAAQPLPRCTSAQLAAPHETVTEGTIRDPKGRWACQAPNRPQPPRRMVRPIGRSRR